MEAFAVIVAIAAITLLGKVLYVRLAGRRHRPDPEAVKHVRLTGDGGGWLCDYDWPRRKARDKHQ
jgi:hypothetical protein